jgi:hypothetical protein
MEPEIFQCRGHRITQGKSGALKKEVGAFFMGIADKVGRLLALGGGHVR